MNHHSTRAEYFSASAVDMDVVMGQTTTTTKNLLVSNEIFF